ncbi:MAG: ABC transporter ATP-binding protein, partial [Pseudomonadota bacterium]
MSEEINTNLLSNKKKSATLPLVSRLVRSYLRPYYRKLALAVFFMLIAAGMTAAFAAMVQPVIDDVLVAGRQGRILGLSAVIMILFVIRGGATYFHTVIMNVIGQSIVADAQNHLFSHFMSLDLRFFHDHPSGELLSRVVNDVNVMRMAVTEVLTSLGKSLLTFIFLAGVMFYQDWKLALAAFTIFPIAALFVVWIGKRLRKQSKKIQTGVADLSDHLSQIFQGVRLVKAYGMENHESDRAEKKIFKVRDTVIKTEQIANLSTPVNEFLAGVILFGILLYGGLEVANGNTTAGALMSFITAFIMSYEPLKRLAKLNNKLQMGLGAAERMFDILDTKASIASHPSDQSISFKAPKIRFENAEFQYHDDEKKALDGVNFDILGGKVTALVG